MATGKNIRTWHNGQWQDDDVAIIHAADHGAWLGTTVFDGARYFEGVTPDLDAHCARLNRSAVALMITPTVTAAAMAEIIRDGLRRYPPEAAVYIRPMYWAIDGDQSGIVPREGATGFAICLEEIPMADPETSVRLTTTRFRRPVLESSVCNAKAGCLYPNNARMLVEAQRKGFGNALVTDALGNVAETATANVFIVKDGVVMTPIANGTFLSGITRARHIANMRQDGIEVHECILGFDDVAAADEVFLSGNFSKVMRVKRFDDTEYRTHAMTDRIRALYLDWALGQRL